MYVVAMLYHPPQDEDRKAFVGWRFALHKPEEYDPFELAYPYAIKKAKTQEWLSWWEKRHYMISTLEESATFQINAELAVELLLTWVVRDGQAVVPKPGA